MGVIAGCSTIITNIGIVYDVYSILLAIASTYIHYLVFQYKTIMNIGQT